ncbi:MAG: hypothetical protein MUC59_01320 [Saprospiraceae bacterium]|nr:hypothetical protein [Saprospiraceae bacterium]
MTNAKKILVAPLGWGLGHASRCIPIVQELLKQGAEVLLASDGRALELLKQEFPQLTSLELPSYDVQYRTQNMAWNIASQLPKILRAIWLEHRALRQIVTEHSIDGVVSDNRFGCFSRKKPCVFITHQLNIPVANAFGGKLVNFFNHLIIKQFHACWVPDLRTSLNLTGNLSHPVPAHLSKKTKYIGALTRMVEGKGQEIRYDAIAVLSGPEPQRSQLELVLLEQAHSFGGSLLIVQGQPERGAAGRFSPLKNVEIVPSLTTEALNVAIAQGEVFIGRSGYSTVMDLARLGKPALLVPTPGQPEQVYLAEKLSEEGSFFTQNQSNLNLVEGIAEAKRRKGLQPVYFDEKALAEAVASLLKMA